MKYHFVLVVSGGFFRRPRLKKYTFKLRIFDPCLLQAGTPEATTSKIKPSPIE